MMVSSEDTWQRVVNFGRHSHIINRGKTLCGRDIENSRTIIQRNPQKKCKRCYNLANAISPISLLKIPA